MSLQSIPDSELEKHIASVDSYLKQHGCTNMTRVNHYLDMRFIWRAELNRRIGAQAFLKQVFYAD